MRAHKKVQQSWENIGSPLPHSSVTSTQGMAQHALYMVNRAYAERGRSPKGSQQAKPHVSLKKKICNFTCEVVLSDAVITCARMPKCSARRTPIDSDLQLDTCKIKKICIRTA
jgi:hypothetical protein